MSMIRKQVFITAEQNRLLKAHARTTGQAEAELIRNALNRQLGIEVEGDTWKQHIMECAGSLAEVDDLAAIVQRNREQWNDRLKLTSQHLQGDE